MAIEDAATLAEALSLKDLSLTKALLLYEKIRTPRITAVKKRGDFNRIAYHATGPIAVVRNFIMKIRTPESIISSLDWLYTYDAMNLTKMKEIYGKKKLIKFKILNYFWLSRMMGSNFLNIHL